MNNREKFMAILKDIADAIRIKTGKTELIRARDFAKEIEKIPSFCVDTSLELKCRLKGNVATLSATLRLYRVSEVILNGFVPNASILFLDKENNLLAEGLTNKKGFCEVTINLDETIEIHAEFKGKHSVKSCISNIVTVNVN